MEAVLERRACASVPMSGSRAKSAPAPCGRMASPGPIRAARCPDPLRSPPSGSLVLRPVISRGVFGTGGPCESASLPRACGHDRPRRVSEASVLSHPHAKKPSPSQSPATARTFGCGSLVRPYLCGMRGATRPRQARGMLEQVPSRTQPTASEGRSSKAGQRDPRSLGNRPEEAGKGCPVNRRAFLAGLTSASCWPGVACCGRALLHDAGNANHRLLEPRVAAFPPGFLAGLHFRDAPGAYACHHSDGAAGPLHGRLQRRNLCGSTGVTLVTTLLARRSQIHQTTLTGHLDQWSIEMAARPRTWRNHFVSHGADTFTVASRPWPCCTVKRSHRRTACGRPTTSGCSSPCTAPC